MAGSNHTAQPERQRDDRGGDGEADDPFASAQGEPGAEQAAGGEPGAEHQRRGPGHLATDDEDREGHEGERQDDADLDRVGVDQVEAGAVEGREQR